MTGYQSKRAAAQAIDKVNWADHEPNGLAQPQQERLTSPVSNIGSAAPWVMRITADRRIEVNEDVEVTEAAQKVLDALQNLLKPAQPEQRTWVGLTDEEIDSFSLDYSLPYSTRSFARAIESKLKEKNT